MPRIKLDPFVNVGEGKKAVLITEALWPNTIEQIGLYLRAGSGGAIAPANIAEISVKLGSKEIWNVTGAQLLDLNEFEGRTAANGALLLPFMNNRARNLAQQYLTAPDLGALNVRKLEIALTVSGSTDPWSVDGWADVVAPGLLNTGGNLVFRQLLRQQLTPSAAEVDKPQSINVGQAKGARLRRLHFFSNLVTDVSIKRDSIQVFEKVPVALQNEFLKDMGWTPQANVYSYVADEDDNADKYLTSIRDDGQGGSLVPQQILMSTSGAGAFDVVADVLAGLNG